jgi:diguanylate cyclase (GGDEF)-like protein/PAS domain S-box-containing protein
MSDSDPSPAANAVVSGGAAARTPWNPIHADSVPPEISSRIEAELIALVYGNIKTALAGQLAAAVLIGFVAWSVVPGATGAGWILALLIVVTVRWRLAREFHSAPARSWPPRVWRRRAIAGSAATGVLWGLGGLLLVRFGDSSHQALSGFVLGGLTAGAVATTSPVRAAYVVLSVPMMFLLAAAYLLWGGSLALPMSGLSLIFLLAMLRTARQMYDTFEHDVRMRLTNEQLVSSLTSTAESLSRSNQELGREVDERRRAEEARRRSESSLKEAQRIGRIASWVIELPNNHLYGSEQLARLFEDDAVLDTTFGWVVERTHPDDREALRQAYEEAIASRGPVEIVQRVIMPDGRIKYLHERGETVRDAEGRPLQLIGTAQDITEQRQAEEQLRLSAQVFEGGVEGVMITDANGRILSVNRAFTEITGYSREEALGKNPRLLQSGMHDSAFYRRIWTSLEAAGHWRGELWDRRKSGEVFPAWFAISSVKDPEGRLTHYVAVFSDISERKAAEDRIEFLAHHDPLTGLPNRILLRDRFELALAQAARNQARVALIFLDIDHFKAVNDSLGHPAGDNLLRQVATRLKACVRASDTVCRQGGDEFLLLVVPVPDPRAASVVAEKVLQVLREPVEIEGHALAVGASIGISVFPDDGDSFDTLLQKADMAMYEAKAAGRNGYRFFSSEMNANALERLNMQNRLRRALELDEFQLHYQPQVDLGSGRIIGIEALLRWTSPDLGAIPPGRFIPIAEESGLIVQIGAWVLRTACQQNQAWQARGLPEVPVAVNLSALQFARGDLLDTVERALEDSGLPARFLELELTESILIHDADNIMASLRRLKNLGIKLSIDDFGTGYSSLSYLKRLAVDKLKIDQSFVRDIASDPDDAAIVRAIIQMGHSLKLRTIAEGVESPDQLAFLRAEGCEEGQGYLFSRPVPAVEMEDLLRSGISAAEFGPPKAEMRRKSIAAC